MQVKLWMVRHGQTIGNVEHRYVGSTDERLCSEGVQKLLKQKKQIQQMKYSSILQVFVSPMRRCRETSEILFPEAEQVAIQELAECDFGTFEYMNYEELNGDSDYQAWIDSGGIIGFPGGEDRATFKLRVLSGFEKLISLIIADAVSSLKEKCGESEITYALVAHGGTLMVILDQYASPHKDYFDWQVKNGSGFIVGLEIDGWQSGNRRLNVIEEIEV